MSVTPKISQTKMELKVDLEELFGQQVSSASARQAIGQALIETIVERTQGGTKLGGGNFKGYSKAYKDSLAYKVGGKEGQPVNLTLTGDMLGTLDIKQNDESSITIGWHSQVQNAKGFNHHTGDTLPARPFFGLQKNELSDIVNEFAREVKVREKLIESGKDGDTKFRRETVSQIRQILLGIEDE